MKQLSEPQAVLMQDMVQFVQSYYNTPDVKTDKEFIMLNAVLKQVLSGELEPFEFAKKMNTLCEMTGVPAKVNYESQSSVGPYKFEVEGK